MVSAAHPGSVVKPEPVQQVEQVTFNESFDGFPMFSPDGAHLVFASNRHASTEGETNVFVADWVD